MKKFTNDYKKGYADAMKDISGYLVSEDLKCPQDVLDFLFDDLMGVVFQEEFDDHYDRNKFASDNIIDMFKKLKEYDVCEIDDLHNKLDEERELTREKERFFEMEEF